MIIIKWRTWELSELAVVYAKFQDSFDFNSAKRITGDSNRVRWKAKENENNTPASHNAIK